MIAYRRLLGFFDFADGRGVVVVIPRYSALNPRDTAARTGGAILVIALLCTTSISPLSTENQNCRTLVRDSS